MYLRNLDLRADFLKNPSGDTGHGLKCVELKKQHHSKKPIFCDKQLCFYTHPRFLHSKGPLCLFQLQEALVMHLIMLRREPGL